MPMGCPWNAHGMGACGMDAYGLPMRYTNGQTMCHAWATQMDHPDGPPMGYPWATHGLPPNPMDAHGLSVGYPRAATKSHGCPWATHMGDPWVTPGLLVECPRATQWPGPTSPLAQMWAYETNHCGDLNNVSIICIAKPTRCRQPLPRTRYAQWRATLPNVSKNDFLRPGIVWRGGDGGHL